MKLITHKPYIIFWVLIPIMLIYGFSLGDSTLDINIYDTYFVTPKLQLWYALSHLFAIYGILYWIIINFNRKTNNFLTSTHLIITITGLILLLIISPIFGIESVSLSKNYDRGNIIIIAEFVITFIILLAQILFVVNLVLSLFRKAPAK